MELVGQQVAVGLFVGSLEDFDVSSVTVDVDDHVAIGFPLKLQGVKT